MLIDLFIEASKEEKAARFLSSFIELAETHSMNAATIEFEEYWKIDDMYKIELRAGGLAKDQLQKFIYQIASKWLELPGELLASKTMEDCLIHLENLNMIIIYFE
ncbi:hypothetical protein B0H99_10333 [Planomicrobium soli]|uniref:Uncharacterized protein n=1 Tax=Planomicrobium soli TaxID=1176648 RepID=A0A2P8H3V5_9BACL|nr:hypothetical protein [Planomicrobium soli]PSL40901.1 hypothetical protein B0H99_10333 [Planomicrobium soli]